MEFTAYPLPNGRDRVHVWPTQKFKTTTVKAFFRRPLDGYATATALLPNVLRRGSQDMPSSLSIERHLEELYGANFNTGVHKLGENHVMEFSLVLANDRYLPGNEKLLPPGIALLHSLVARPLIKDQQFDVEFVAQEKKVQAQYLDSIYNDKGQWALKRCIEIACADEAYARSPNGSLSDIKSITASTLYDFYKQLLQEAPIELFVVGDVNVQEVVDTLSTGFAFANIRQKDPPITLVHKDIGEVNEVYEEDDINQGKLVMCLRTNTSYKEEDFAALLCYNSVLGGGAHSKLFLSVREKHSLAYYIQSHIEQVKGLLFIHCGIDFDKYQQTVDIVSSQLNEMRQGQVSEDALALSKSDIINRLAVIQDSPSSSVAFYLQGIIADKPRTVPRLMEEVQRVTVDDVVQVAHRISVDTIYFLQAQKGVSQ